MRSRSIRLGGSLGGSVRRALAAALLVGACSSAQTETTAPRARASTSTLAGETRRFRSFSDLDPVWAVASTSEHLWVATPGGLLRYPFGGGDPLRIAGDAGPGGSRVVAVLPDGEDGVWALSEGGLARFSDGAWERPAGALPEVGAVTALAVRLDGALVVGGTSGLATFDGGRWTRLPSTVRVTALSVATDNPPGVWVGTESDGLWFVEPDGMVTEHRRDGGFPCDSVRAIATGRARVWVICGRGEEGAALARYDGTRWEAYTAPVAGGLADLASWSGRVVLLTELGLFRVTERHVDEELEEGEILLASIAGEEPARPRRYRATARAAPAAEGEAGAEGRAPPRPFVPMPPPEEEEEEEEEDIPPPRPLLRPVDVREQEGARVLRCDERGIWIGTEGLGVVRVARRGSERTYRTLDLVLADRPFTVAVDAAERAWVVTRDYRAGVLGEGGSFTSETVEADPTAGVDLVAFGARGLGAYALGQVRGSTAVRVYRLGDDGWSLLLSRRIDVPRYPGAAAATEDDGGAKEEAAEEEAAEEEAVEPLPFVPTFFRVDPRGRFWIGASVVLAGHEEPVRRGAIVLDRDVEEVTYHCQHPRGPRAVAIPDEVSAVAFTRAGDAWLGGLSGAVLLRIDGTVARYGESNGLIGDIVNDIAVDREDVPWVATPAGVGHFRRGMWRFFLDTMPRGMAVASLAIDSNGEVWGGGPRGGVHFDGSRWETITRGDGLVSDRVRSVHVDGRDRVWLVTDAGLSLLERRQ